MQSETFWTQWGAFIQDLVIKAIWAVLILLFFWMLSRTLSSLLIKGFSKSRRLDAGVQQLLIRTLRLTIMVFGIVTALGQFINVAPLLTGIGVIGLAVGFAAQDTIKNFIAGITILIDQPFRVGDNIAVDQVFGMVHEITLRSTRIRTLNHEVIVFPNDAMINRQVINHTLLGTLRVEILFSIAYEADLEAARKVVIALCAGDSRVQTNPAPAMVVKGMGDSGVDLSFRFWLTNPQDEVPMRDFYKEQVLLGLQAAQIEIPYPVVRVLPAHEA